jgi:hypothetical protein
MDYYFKINLEKDKQRFSAKIALRRAKRVFALLKAGRDIDEYDLERMIGKFDIYCSIFDDAVKHEKEIQDAEHERIMAMNRKEVVNG